MKLTQRQILLLTTALTYFFDREAQTFTPQYKEDLKEISSLLSQEYRTLSQSNE